MSEKRLHWTPEEDSLAVKLHRNGVPLYDIACRIAGLSGRNVTTSSVSSRLRRISRTPRLIKAYYGSPLEAVAPTNGVVHGDNSTLRTRQCLRCGRKFPSAWAGNRVCMPCKNSADW